MCQLSCWNIAIVPFLRDKCLFFFSFYLNLCYHYPTNGSVLLRDSNLQSLIEAPTPSPSLDSITCFGSLSSLYTSQAQLTSLLWPQLTPYVKPLIRHGNPEHTTVTVTHTCTLNILTCKSGVDKAWWITNQGWFELWGNLHVWFFLEGLSKTYMCRMHEVTWMFTCSVCFWCCGVVRFEVRS